jgi:hypothetical protein
MYALPNMESELFQCFPQMHELQLLNRYNTCRNWVSVADKLKLTSKSINGKIQPTEVYE